MSYVRRLTQLTHLLHQPCGHMDLPDAPEAAIEHFAAIEEHAKQLVAAMQPGAGPTKRLQGPELWTSLATAVVALAKDTTSGRYAAKELKDLVVNYSPPHDMAFWEQQSAGHIVGLLSYELDVRRQVEAEGVMFWKRWEDVEWRIIHINWLEAHADIRRWVTQEWPGGRVCRFCGMEENPKLNALLSVELERRTGVNMLGDVVVLPTGTNTHEECRMHWVKWLQIAYHYPSQEAAEAADQEAGRKPRIRPVQTPAIALQPVQAQASDE